MNKICLIIVFWSKICFAPNIDIRVSNIKANIANDIFVGSKHLGFHRHTVIGELVLFSVVFLLLLLLTHKTFVTNSPSLIYGILPFIPILS